VMDSGHATGIHVVVKILVALHDIQKDCGNF
jgi:hypothetical protein